MFIYISNFTFRSVTNGVMSLINCIYWSMRVLWVCEYLHGCGRHMHAPTWPFCRTWVNVSRHPAARSRDRPVWLFPQSPWKKGRVTDRKNVPGHRGSPTQATLTHPQPQTSTHWTHQVISWGLKYLLCKYLPWLSDPTPQFKDMGLTNFSLYLTNHQDIPRPHPVDRPRTVSNFQGE